jgi:hypothetical protein
VIIPIEMTQNTTPPDDYKTCTHKHELIGTGAVFFQSTGWLICIDCKGWQRIREAIK